MIHLAIDPSIRKACPSLRINCIRATVQTNPSPTELLNLIALLVDEKARIPIEKVKDIPAISAARSAYKAMGKAPSRYRVSAEALHRRVIRGLGLYQISNVVDIINYISLKSGYSIGGYDMDQIQNPIVFSLGRANEIYEAIGRGPLNIEKLPVFRDEKGAFGSPTSDSVRTSIQTKCKQVLMAFVNFGGDPGIQTILDESKTLLEKFALGENIKFHEVF